MAASDRPARVLGPAAIRAVLFDAGDTLIYMPRSREEILLELCRELGAVITPEQAREACLRSERYYVERYLGYTGDQADFWHRYHGEALRYLGIDDPTGAKAAHLSHGFGRGDVWRAFPEAAGVCGRLRALGLRLGVVSNGAATVPDLLASAGLLPLFDVVVTSQEVGTEKPDPRIFTTALERLGVASSAALFVGDLYEVDVLGARAAGMAGVLVDREGTPKRDCPVIRNLAELVPMITESGNRRGEDVTTRHQDTKVDVPSWCLRVLVSWWLRPSVRSSSLRSG